MSYLGTLSGTLTVTATHEKSFKQPNCRKIIFQIFGDTLTLRAEYILSIKEICVTFPKIHPFC